MSKQKQLYYIETMIFDKIQQLSIFVYRSTINEKNFNFENYFENTYRETILESLKNLEVTDPEPYKEVYYDYLLTVYEMSVNNAILFMKMFISNRNKLFEFWQTARKEIICKILDIYINMKK